MSLSVKVVLIKDVYEKIMYWVMKAPGEISGLGLVEMRSGVPHVVDAFLLPQENTGSSTDIEPEDVAKAEFEHRSSPHKLRFWWHSHASMNVFWSQTDKDTMAVLGQAGWFISTVFNKKQEMKTALTVGDPFPFFMDDVPTTLAYHLTDEQKAAMDAEYTANIKESKWYGGKDWVEENWKKNRASWSPKPLVHKVGEKYYWISSGREASEQDFRDYGPEEDSKKKENAGSKSETTAPPATKTDSVDSEEAYWEAMMRGYE